MRRESVENKTVLEMLERHTFMTPDRTAVICEPQERISYKELWELSGCLYSWIKKRGIGAEDIVMFCLPRGISLFACMIGTMRAGAAFVLAESGNEQKRTEFIRNDCGCSLFVDEKDWEDIIRTKPLEGYEEIRLTVFAILHIPPERPAIRKVCCMNTDPWKMHGSRSGRMDFRFFHRKIHFL